MKLYLMAKELWRIPTRGRAARAFRFHFPVVRRNICLEAFIVSFQFSSVLLVPFPSSRALPLIRICGFKSPWK